MDKVIEKIAGLGLPGLVLLLLVGTSRHVGAAAITSSLAALGGPLGMLGGVATLGILSMISQSVTRYGFDNVLKGVIVKMKSAGKTEAEIIEFINKLPLSSSLKSKMTSFIAAAFRGL